MTDINNIKVFTNIISHKYIGKVGKHLVEVGVMGSPKEKLWLSEKQWNKLEEAFSYTTKGFSSKYKYVEAYYNNKSFYLYCRFIEEEKKRYFTIPKEHDLSDLWED